MYCSDEEGVRLIRSGGAVHKKGDSWKESDSGGACYYYTVSVTISVTIAAQVLTLESLASSNVDDSIDPFTNRLLEFEVILTSLIVIATLV